MARTTLYRRGMLSRSGRGSPVGVVVAGLTPPGRRLFTAAGVWGPVATNENSRWGPFRTARGPLVPPTHARQHRYRQCRSRYLLSSPGLLAEHCRGSAPQDLRVIIAQWPRRHQAKPSCSYQGLYASNLLRAVQNMTQEVVFIDGASVIAVGPACGPLPGVRRPSGRGRLVRGRCG